MDLFVPIIKVCLVVQQLCTFISATPVKLETENGCKTTLQDSIPLLPELLLRNGVSGKYTYEAYCMTSAQYENFKKSIPLSDKDSSI